MIRGYCRISTSEQDLGRQITALEKHGVEIMYQDIMSGGKASRPELDRMLAELELGDTVVVQKLDRLGRSLVNLIELIKDWNTRGIHFVSLSDNFDTRSSVGMLCFHIIAAFAQFERDIIRERTKDGLAYKKSIGVKLGRKHLDEQTKIEIIRLRDTGMNGSQIARELGVSRPTVYKVMG